MKRLVLTFVLLLAATGAMAQSRDVLLTPDGTLYTVDVASSEASAIGGQLYLQVTARQGKTVTTTNVPESMNGLNLRPALAYDDQSQTLFVLWLHRGQNSLSNELNLASYHEGKWQPAVAIDSHASWGEVRLNLRIGITRRVSQLQKDGTYTDAPALLVHAVWWEDNSVDGEGARYALIPIDKGTVGAIDVHALREFTDPATTPVEVNDDFNRDFLRHPTMIESPTSTTVDVIFGDLRTNTVNRVTLKPVADSRVHIPGGIHGGRPIGAPRALSADWSGHVTTIDGRDGRTMFVNTTTAAVSYITYANGSWSQVKSVTTDEKFTADAAMAALAKMLASE